MTRKEEILDELYNHTIDGDDEPVIELTNEGLSIEMTPMEILVASTQNAARVLRRETTLGTLEAGKQADVLVVRGDPLADLEALTDPLLVIHKGVVIRDETAPKPGS